MLLTFSKFQFVTLIRSGVKIHTIRLDRGKRWAKGVRIHFWKGNPRNVKSNPYAFDHDKDVCVSTQIIQIYHSPDGHHHSVAIDGRPLGHDEIEILAKNDGFSSSKEFFKWFSDDFTGKIIHWTEHKY